MTHARRAGLLVLLGLAACSVDHRSGDFVCTRTADCTGNRVCVDGFCVDPTAPDAAGGIDGRPGTVDARVDADLCPPECTTCDPAAHSCFIDCSGNSDCNSTVHCPTGWSCQIQCDGDNSCRNGIDCRDADACTISCGGQSSCRGVVCGFGPCDIQCTAENACRNIDCQASCACDVLCAVQGTCGDSISCPFGCDAGFGCSSSFPGCAVCL